MMMDKHYIYKPTGVCAKEINFDLVDGVVHNVEFVGGCRGNSQGVAHLSEGMRAQDVIKRCKGIDCHGGNSCPNQLAIALEQCMAE